MRPTALRLALASVATVALSVASAQAQSFNLDGGAPATPPSTTYGAGAMQPGVWNDCPQGVAGQPLVNLFGAPTSVTVTTNAGADFMFDNAGTTGDDELLMDDLLDAPSSVIISGLAPGTYTVYTYAWAPDSAAGSTEVTVTNSPDIPQACGGAWPGGHQLGVTYTMHGVTVDAANPNIEITFVVLASFASCNGIQIVDPTGGSGGIGTAYCGPAVVNSTGVPAEIIAIGNPVAAGNNVTLEASDLPLNSFGFFLTSQTQGFVANPGGSQGNLCLGGAIGRFVGPGQIQNSGTAGSISLLLDLTLMPQPTGPVAVVAGETWNFQAWYRDAVGGSAVSNFTNGTELMFL